MIELKKIKTHLQQVPQKSKPNPPPPQQLFSQHLLIKKNRPTPI